MSATEETLRLLKSIDASLRTLVALVGANGAHTDAGQRIATARELDGQWGDPEVRFDPRDWTGPSFKRRRLSQCPPDYLDLLAEAFEYFARKAEEKDERTDKGKPVAEFRKSDAAKARGWAKRMRDGEIPTPQVEAGTADGWSDDSAGWN